MTDRLKKIFNLLSDCEVFADIGCDHGYVAKEMLVSGKCKRVIVSDISAKCLKKAEQLLFNFIQDGRAESVVSDGFEKVKNCDQALIAGMGGEEIVSIITRAKELSVLPKRLVVQPMKNCDKVRLCALKVGYKIDYDKVFKSGDKYYNLIVLTFGSDSLTDEEIEFGRNNVQELPQDFVQMIKDSVLKLTAFRDADGVDEKVKNQLDEKIKKLKKYV